MKVKGDSRFLQNENPGKMSRFEFFLSTWEYFKDFTYAIKNIEDLVN